KDGIIGFADGLGRVLSLDYEGRLLFFTLNSTTYRRTLLNKFIELRIENGERRVSEVPAEVARSLVSDARNSFDEAISSNLPKELKDRVSILRERIDYDWLERDANGFRQVYGGGVPIIPPDQYFSIYIRFSEGCPWNRCSFCTLYPGIRYRVKSVNEISSQINSLLSLLGQGMESRKSVFLGDANAINVDTHLLVEVLQLIKREIGLPVYAFTDAFTTAKNKDVKDFLLIRENGLKRLYIGIESGDESVLKFLNKPLDISIAKREIEDIKRAGIEVGVIVMSGPGGRVLANQHVERTVEFLLTLPLGRGDVVYVSPIKEYEGSDYLRIARENNLGIMSIEEKLEQAETIKAELRSRWIRKFSHPPEFQIAPYLLEEAVY
ncbi:MAG: radical SAM protein, partial [Thermoplasmatales archaeon]